MSDYSVDQNLLQRGSNDDFRPFHYSLARPYRDTIKRALDVLFVLAASPLIVPAVALLALIVRRDSGPSFYGHTRVGKDGRTFRCWKIRSMVANADAILAEYLADNPSARVEWERTQKLERDPRITRLGRFLRKSSLDELPQLWNVLRGDMSLVGPRPVTGDELSKYGDDKEKYLSVRPGITGLWQVSGRNDVSYAERVALDANYAESVSFSRDTVIMLKTVGVVLRPNGR